MFANLACTVGDSIRNMGKNFFFRHISYRGSGAQPHSRPMFMANGGKETGS